jgi:hypothetical protein
MKLSSHINSLRGLTAARIEEIVQHYKDFESVEYENRDLDLIVERYFMKNSYKYTINMLKKCLFWYLYNKQVPGLRGELRL